MLILENYLKFNPDPDEKPSNPDAPELPEPPKSK
jgi:hypothetical protein